MKIERKKVCGDCLIAIANDDYTGMDDETEARVKDGIAAVKGYWVAGNEEHGFSWQPCECCKSHLAGDRYEASIIS
jgi:hypothetical protein